MCFTVAMLENDQGYTVVLLKKKEPDYAFVVKIAASLPSLVWTPHFACIHLLMSLEGANLRKFGPGLDIKRKCQS